MAQVTVRNLHDHVVLSLRLKAELKGHSLEQELREILIRAAEKTSAPTCPRGRRQPLMP